MAPNQSRVTEVIPIDPDHPAADAIARAADLLRRGELVAFPTETVYGLGADALNAEAVARIFAAKGRPATNPIIVHVADADGAKQLVTDWPEAAQRLAARLWPGPLTIVLPRREVVPAVVTAGGATVAVRVPAHPVALALIRASGRPLAAPSANPSAALSPTQAEHVFRGLGGKIALILDGGPTPGGLESTVLDLTATPPRLLRPGMVSRAQIEAVIGPVAGVKSGPSDAAVPVRSPGHMPRHYAPATPLECCEGTAADRVRHHCAQEKRVGWLALSGEQVLALPGLTVVVMPGEPLGYAAQLYALLHDLDRAGLDRIVVTLPPDEEPWLAVRDRLRRAATRGES